MEKFLKKLFLFGMIPTIFFGFNGLVNWFIYSSDKIEYDHNVLIAGDSHLRKGLVPTLFNDGINISQAAEPYVITFWKLKKILNASTIDTVIVGFAPHNISAFNDLKFSKKRWASEMFKRTYPISEFENIEELVEVDRGTFYRTLWSQTAFYPKPSHFNYIGNYLNYDTSHVSDYKQVIQRHYFEDEKPLGTSEISISSMDSIITLTERTHTQLVLISTPVHKDYRNGIPDHILKKYSDLKNTYMQRNILIFDESTTPYPDDLFLNSDHLNSDGANKFTKKIIDLLKNQD